MKWLLLIWPSLFFSWELCAQDSYQLAPPLVRYASVFFRKNTRVEIKFAQQGAAVYYTTDGTEPTENSNYYTKPVLISRGLTVLKVKAFGKNFLPSVTDSFVFIRDGLPVSSIVYTSPDAKYPGNGKNALTDNKGGNNLFSSHTWLGFDCDTVHVMLTLKRKQPVQSVLVNLLQNEASWIFLPDKITARYYDETAGEFLPFAEETIASVKETPGSHCVYRLLSSAEKKLTHRISLQLLVKRFIPDWHTGKGSHAWMFMDEIKLY